jgi:ketosteroid isomerase-like protein
MSQGDVELVRAAWDAFERGDLDRATAIFAPDVEWDVSRDIWRDVVGGGHYRGIEGVLTWLRDLYEAWETFDMSYEDGIDAGGGQVVGILCAKGRGRVSGAEVEHHPASVTTVSEGKVTRVVWYPSREEALAAVGLRE